MDTSFLIDAWTALMWRACWQGSLVVLAVWSICRLLPSMPARFQCWFWRLAMLKFAIVLVLPSFVDLPLLPAPAIATPEIISQPSTTVVLAKPQRIVSWDSKLSSPNAIETLNFRGILYVGWIIGVACCAVRLVGDWRKSKRLRRRCEILRHAPTIDLLMAQSQLFGLRRPPRLLEVAGSGSPMLVGIFRPAIIVPAATLRRLSHSELTLALGHEMAHIRRVDLWWEFLAAMIRTVLFFHPLIWWSSRQLRLVQEAAADELVIARQRHDAGGYGRLLVLLVGKLGVRPIVSALSLETAGPVHSLTWRLFAMTHIGRTSRRVIIFSGLLLGAAVPLGLLPWRLVAAEPKKPDQTALLGEKESFRIVPPAPYAAAAVESKVEKYNNASLPAYVVEPPDVLSIEMPKLKPLSGIQFLHLQMADGPVNLHDKVLINKNGEIDLGQPHGTLKVANMTTDEMRKAIEKKVLEVPYQSTVSVKLSIITAPPVTGQFLVSPDGTINIPVYGQVKVVPMNAADIKKVLQKHLSQYFDSPEVSVDIVGYNSKVYYVITEDEGRGDNVQRIHVTGNETVLDALATVGKLPRLSIKKVWVARHVQGDSGSEQILPVDYAAITRGISMATNYQIMPGDRVFIAKEKEASQAPANESKAEKSSTSGSAFELTTRDMDSAMPR